MLDAAEGKPSETRWCVIKDTANTATPAAAAAVNAAAAAAAATSIAKKQRVENLNIIDAVAGRCGTRSRQECDRTPQQATCRLTSAEPHDTRIWQSYSDARWDGGRPFTHASASECALIHRRGQGLSRWPLVPPDGDDVEATSADPRRKLTMARILDYKRVGVQP